MPEFLKLGIANESVKGRQDLALSGTNLSASFDGGWPRKCAGLEKY